MMCSFLWAQILIPEQPPPQQPQGLPIAQASDSQGKSEEPFFTRREVGSGLRVLGQGHLSDQHPFLHLLPVVLVGVECSWALSPSCPLSPGDSGTLCSAPAHRSNTPRLSQSPEGGREPGREECLPSNPWQLHNTGKGPFSHLPVRPPRLRELEAKGCG